MGGSADDVEVVVVKDGVWLLLRVWDPGRKVVVGEEGVVRGMEVEDGDVVRRLEGMRGVEDVEIRGGGWWR